MKAWTAILREYLDDFKVNVRHEEWSLNIVTCLIVTQQKTVNEYDQRQYSVNDLQREELSENSRFVYSKINSCHGQRPYNGI